MTPQQRQAVRTLVKIILETVAETEGGPESHFYLPLSQHVSPGQFQQLMGQLYSLEALTNKGHWISKGPKFDSLLKGLTQ